jgi:hypothetical protein
MFDPLTVISLAGACSMLILSIGLAVRIGRQKIPPPPVQLDHGNHHQGHSHGDMRAEMMRRLGQELNRSYVPRQRNIQFDDTK